MKGRLLLLALLLLFAGIAVMSFSAPSQAAVDEKTAAAIDKWIQEFQPSALSKEEQKKELEWFAEATKPYKGMTITSCSETISAHIFDHDVCAKAFEEICGITVKHDLIAEGDVVDRIARQVQTKRKIYDLYVNDSDLIGWHMRSCGIVNLSEYMKGEGKDITNPYQDWDDFMNLDFCKDPDGNIFQIPDQQFAALYWFRYDWYNREDLKKAFKEKYGYELGCALNWAAYEDICEFFTGREIDGKKVWGHFDFAKKGPDLGWRFTDAWLALAGAIDKGLPNGIPVDDWGIRAENNIPVGASMSRGGAADSPAAVYAVDKYLTWNAKYAPPAVYTVSATEMLSMPKMGDIASACFYYIIGLWEPGYKKPPMTDEKGNLNWRVAPHPHGKYWQEGMKSGYQDCGAWTICKDSVGPKERAVGWLFSQFCTSKTLDLKKFLFSNGPIRYSTIWHPYLTENMKNYGGVIEFYRSKYESLYTPSYWNVPHYPLLAEQWWKNIGPALFGQVTAEVAMKNLAKSMDDLMGKMKLCKWNPKLGEVKDAQYWIDQPGAPYPEIKEREKPLTMQYEELIKQWAAEPPKKK